MLVLRLLLLPLRLRPGECRFKRHLEVGRDDIVHRTRLHRLEERVILDVG
jgi:hypothetical protein